MLLEFQTLFFRPHQYLWIQYDRGWAGGRGVGWAVGAGGEPLGGLFQYI